MYIWINEGCRSPCRKAAKVLHGLKPAVSAC